MEAFKQFLEEFIPPLAKKNRQLNKILWILETTGSQDAADLKGELDAECRLLCSDRQIYQKLLSWNKEPIADPLLKRQLNVLIRTFKENVIPEELLQKIAQKEGELFFSYANFRAEIDGKKVSDNEIKAILKKENKVNKRKQAWEASKEIGDLLAEKVLELVTLRNQAALGLGYANFFSMQLDLQEVNEEWLFAIFTDLQACSNQAYVSLCRTIEKVQCDRFQVPLSELGPWAWSDPFGQEDPLGAFDLDLLVDGHDICDLASKFYLKMGFDVAPIFKCSDMYERPGKCQQAFCIHLDRKGDIRTLNNVTSTLKWLETVLHEYGHAIYELNMDHALPWLLQTPPHMIPTEAMALLSGRQAYRADSLSHLIGATCSPVLLKRAEESLIRRQLIFSRWVLVMTHFEKALYSQPNQDLNALWWHMVEKYQGIRTPKGREGKHDWAAKYHIGLSPVYYFSYLLGEMFASSLEKKMQELFGTKNLASRQVGTYLAQKLFFPGNRMDWMSLAKSILENPLNSGAWLEQFI